MCFRPVMEFLEFGSFKKLNGCLVFYSFYVSKEDYFKIEYNKTCKNTESQNEYKKAMKIFKLFQRYGYQGKLIRLRLILRIIVSIRIVTQISLVATVCIHNV